MCTVVHVRGPGRGQHPPVAGTGPTVSPANAEIDDSDGYVAFLALLYRCHDRAALTAVMQRLVAYHELPDVAILARLHAFDGSPIDMPDAPPLLRASLVMAMTRPGSTRRPP